MNFVRLIKIDVTKCEVLIPKFEVLKKGIPFRSSF